MKKIKTSGENRKTISTNQHVVRKTTDDVPALKYNIVTGEGGERLPIYRVITSRIQEVK